MVAVKEEFQTFLVRVPRVMHSSLKHKAIELRTSSNRIIVELIERFLNDNP